MIQVLDRAMRILELLGEEPNRTFPLSEIADRVQLDKGTCSRIVKSLSERGFVHQEMPRSGYKLGYKLYHITGSSVNNDELTKIARKDIEDLGRELNETALLAAVHNDKRIVLYSTIPDRNIIVRAYTVSPLYSVCAGRVILAHYTPSHLEKCIIRLGLPTEEEWPEIYASESPEQELINALTRIKQNGYDILEDKNGLIGFAAPLFLNGHVAGSIGTFLPTNRLTDRKAILERLLFYAEEINRKLAKTLSASL